MVKDGGCPSSDVVRLAEFDADSVVDLLDRYGMSLVKVARQADIPGSFWGEPEAGLVDNRLYARADTPVHSILHEASHFICMDPHRRQNLHTDAGGDYDEENGVCYLQVLLSDQPGFMGRERMFEDMDSWGYSFRLGGSKRWFYKDADDALQWLIRRGLLSGDAEPCGALRL